MTHKDQLIYVGPLERGYRAGIRLPAPSLWRASLAWLLVITAVVVLAIALVG